MNYSWLDSYRIFQLARLFFYVMVSFAALYGLAEVIFYLWVDYPFNKYEPEVALEAWRISQGEPIYTPLDTGPYAGLYAPLFQLTGAFLYLIFGESITILRLVSIASLAGIAIFGWKLASRQTWWQLLFASILIVIWHSRVVQFDMHAKPDSFAIMLGIVAILPFFAHGQIRSYAWLISALLAALAFAAKQPMLLFTAGIGVALLLHGRWKEGFSFGFAFLGISVVLWWILSMLTGDEILFYTLIQPGGFDIPAARLAGAALSIVNNWWFPVALILMLRRWLNKNWHLVDTLLLSSLIFAYPASILTAAKGGGLSNGYMPFYYLIAVIIVRNFQIEALFRPLSFSRLPAAFTHGCRSGVALYFGLALFFTIGLNPASYITSWQFRATAHQNYEELASWLKDTEGDVYAPMDNYLTLKIDRPWYWSAKSEMDLSAVKPDIQRRYRKKALEADITVAVDWDDWYSSSSMEEDLEEAGYSMVKELPMEQGATYRIWKQNE